MGVAIVKGVVSIVRGMLLGVPATVGVGTAKRVVSGAREKLAFSVRRATVEILVS